MPESATIDSPAPAQVDNSPLSTSDPELGDPLSRFDDKPPEAPKASEKPRADKPQQVNIKTPPEEKKEAKVEKQPEKPKEEKAEKQPEKPKEEKSEEDTGKMAPKALRDAYDKLKREHKEREVRFNSELETARKSTAPKEDPEKAELSTKYADLEKRYKDLDGEMRYIHFQKSSEFQDKYYKPYVEQYKDAAAKMMSWKGVGEDVTTPRDVTAKDFEDFIKFTSDDDAEAFAKKMFGSESKTARAMTLRDGIINAEAGMRKVSEEFRKNGEARHKEFQAQTEKHQQQMAEQWTKLNTDAIEKYPQWFKADEGDEKGAELLKKGFELADIAFSGTSELPPEKTLALHSAIRNHAAGFRYMVHKYETANARVAELEKELADYKASEPGKGEIKSDKAKEDEDALPALLRD